MLWMSLTDQHKLERADELRTRLAQCEHREWMNIHLRSWREELAQIDEYFAVKNTADFQI